MKLKQLSLKQSLNDAYRLIKPEREVIQEVITLIVFTLFTIIFFKNETLRTNHLIGFCFLILAVYFIFKK